MKLSREFKVGLFMVVSITLLYFGFNFLKGIDFFSTSKKYYTIFTNIDKLTESNQIYLNGYAVGRVSDIEIQQSRNRVVVELDISSDIEVTDASVATLNGELLGGRFIELNIKPGRTLDDKDTIPSQIARGLMEIFAENAQPVAANLQTTLKKLNTVLDNLSQNSQHLDAILLKLSATPGKLNETMTTATSEIGKLSSSFQSVAGNLNANLEQLKPTLQNFHTFSDSLKAMELTQTINKAQQSLTKLDLALAKLSKGDNTMGKLMTEDTLYVNLNRLLKSVDSLATHFNEYPNHFLAPLGKSRRKIERDLRKD